MRKKILALCLSLLLIASLAACGSGSQGADPAPDPTVSSEDLSNTAEGKENVYVFTGADGSVNKIIGADSIPVSLEITYTLDGQPISADRLAGASGHLEMQYSFTSTESETVRVDGKKQTVPVPFVMLSALLLDHDTCSDIRVSTGKLVDDGNSTLVVGLALPGVGEALDLDPDTLDIPASFTVTAEVHQFSMINTYTYGTTEVFQNLDLEGLTDLDDLKDAVDQMQDAMDQLLDGSDQLYDGLCTLLASCEDLVQGVDALSDGAGTLAEGTDTLNTGMLTLYQGSQSLYAGLQALVSNNDTLNGGAKQVFETLLATAQTQLEAAGLTVPALTIDNYATVLNDLIDSLDPGNLADQAREMALEQVTTAVDAQLGTIQAAVTDAVQQQVTEQVTATVQIQVESQVTAAVREQVTKQVLASKGMTPDSYTQAVTAGLVSQEEQDQIAQTIAAQMASEAMQNTVAANLEQQMASEDIQDSIETNVQAQMHTEEIQTTISQNTVAQRQALIEENMNGAEVQAQITTALETASSGAAQISALKEQLDAYRTFYEGLLAYTAGVSSAADGAAQVEDGSAQLVQGSGALASGAKELEDGIPTLASNVPDLISGITQLRDGAGELSDGLTEFQTEAVDKLASAVDGDLNDLVSRLKALQKASQAYSEKTEFILRTEAIGD